MTLTMSVCGVVFLICINKKYLQFETGVGRENLEYVFIIS